MFIQHGFFRDALKKMTRIDIRTLNQVQFGRLAEDATLLPTLKIAYLV